MGAMSRPTMLSFAQGALDAAMGAKAKPPEPEAPKEPVKKAVERVGHNSHTSLKSNVQDGGMQFNRTGATEKMQFRVGSRFSQEVTWAWDAFYRSGAAARHGILGAATAGVGYYILHQYIWRGTGCNINS